MYALLRKNYPAVLRIVVCLLVLLSCGSVSAQQKITVETINKQFDQALHYVNSDNPEKALPILETITVNSKKIGYNKGITRVGHTLAIIYFNSSDYNKVISLSDEYLKIGKAIKDYEKLSHIHRLKGCAYSELGLLNKSSEEFNQALSYAKQITTANNRHHAISVIYGNRSNLFIKSATSQDSVYANINKSISEAEKISEADTTFISKKYSLIAYSYIILASEYAEVGKQQQAASYYLKSLAIHNAKPVPLIERVVLLNQLGYFYNEQQEYQKALTYAEMGLALEKKASFPQLRRDLYEILSKSYLELHNTEDSKQYLKLFTALNDSILKIDKQAVDTAMNTTISQQKKIYSDKRSRQTVLYSLSGVTLLVIGSLLFWGYKKQKQKQIAKIESVLQQLQAKADTTVAPLTAVPLNGKTPDKDEETTLMSPEAEEKLLEKLHNFEKKELYRERKVSLSYVAAEIETNTKYLSYIIKKHKEKDFNKYINDLRIQYIVQKINDNPLYRQFKINALAEECGFSSHSKFAVIFKSTVGVSPSEFIKYLGSKA